MYASVTRVSPSVSPGLSVLQSPGPYVIPLTRALFILALPIESCVILSQGFYKVNRIGTG